MDILTLLGLIVAFGALLGGNALEGGTLGALINGPAFMIVFGGTLGAIMLQCSKKVFLHALKISKWIFKPPKVGIHAGIDDIIEWSNIARKEGLFALQEISDGISDPFLRRSLELLIDGGRPEDVRAIMETEIDTLEARDTAGAKVYDGLGGYAPTVGIIGAVMGLITVMQNLSEPEKLGAGIAVAFVATIYAVALANILFLPMANKLKQIIADTVHYQMMMLEGVLAIAEGVHPHFIKARLQSYLDDGSQASGDEPKE